MNILGISAFYHDSAAALVCGGEIMAAAQEERFTRKKFDASFPVRSIRYCLSAAGIAPKDLDAVVFYDSPRLKLHRLIETHKRFAPHGFSGFHRAARALLGGKIDQKALLEKGLAALDPAVDWTRRIVFGEHHLSHAASSFFPSPFESAAVLTMDGVGEWATTTIGHGRGADITLLKEMHFPDSVGLLYSAFTDYLGFKVNSDEYKIMGLAPYGVPKFAPLIFEKIVDLKDDGSLRLNMEYFDYPVGRRMVNEAFGRVFDQKQRTKAEPILQFHMDVAASIQAVTEEVVKRLALHAIEVTGERKLCLAGGVALNCVANGKLLRLPEVEAVWIQPAAGDAGGALGAALLYGYQQVQSRAARPGDSMKGGLLGPEYTNEEIAAVLRDSAVDFEAFADDAALCAQVAQHIEVGRVIGWFQGRMEYGPRALGARSIIGDPRNAAMQRMLNLKVKFRESYRPFAPVVLAEHAQEWFDLRGESPYMLLVAPVAEARRVAVDPALAAVGGVQMLDVIRSEIPAVTHVDYSARVQTVDTVRNPKFRRLLEAFYARTGCPVLINTSFNVNDEPIVCSPQDAVRCFLSTNIDFLCIGNFIVWRRASAVRGPAGTENAKDLDNIYAIF